MKQAVKKILVKLGVMHLYRGFKYLLFLLKPSHFFSNIKHRLKGAADGFAIPPVFLIYLTVNIPSIADYFRGGHVTSFAIRNLFKKNEIDPEKFKTILELGSGCGRVLRTFADLKNTVLYGSDYNPTLVHWCQKNFHFANFILNQLEPPLNFEAEKFDFIYLISVFTHLPKKTQENWLKELHRVLKKEAYLLITLHGEHLLQELSKYEKEKFIQNGYLERDADKPGSNHFGTFHTKDHFQEMIEGQFKVVDISYGGQPNHPYQDLYLLKKLD